MIIMLPLSRAMISIGQRKSCLYKIIMTIFFIFVTDRLMLKFSKKQEEESKKREITLDMLQPSRYKPNNLQQMADETKFSKRMYYTLLKSVSFLVIKLLNKNHFRCLPS